MAFIVSRMLKKGMELGSSLKVDSNDDVWMQLMLSPYDYGHAALSDPDTRALMQKIEFSHGGSEYDEKYPDGIPTSMTVTTKSCGVLESGFVMYPTGHARNTPA